MTLWLFSLAIEAVLALLYRRRGGFPAFRRFLWLMRYRLPVGSLYLGAPLDSESRRVVLDRQEAEWRALEPLTIERPAFVRFLWADIIGQAVEIADIQFLRGAGYPWVLFGAEIVAGVLLGFMVAECFGWSSKGARKLLLISALVAIPAHLLLAVPAWSPAGSLLLWSVALSHSVMGILLALMLITARRFRWHDAILSSWMLGTAVLFYAAPSFAAGRAVLWLNCAAWAALIATTSDRQTR